MSSSSPPINSELLTSTSIRESPYGLELQNSTSSSLPIEDSDSIEHASHQARSAISSAVARHALGLILLMFVVFLWTASNFMGSTIFADNTYAKPFFLTYLDTSILMLALIPVLTRSGYRNWRKGTLRSSLRRFTTHHIFSESSSWPGEAEPEAYALLKDDDEVEMRETRRGSLQHLDTWSTARLSFYFCILWFVANYFALACLQHTTVASTTVLTSTSSIWTLLVGAMTRAEKFTWRKLGGVVASLLGVFLISQVDLSTPSNSTSISNPSEKRDSLGKAFPHKTASELALGDALAALSAILYGIYTITLKRATSSAAQEGKYLSMPLFFGLVGLINAIILFPLFPILSVLKIEPFQSPPTRRIWIILLANGIASLVSDICWAYAMVLTSPLVVTVGLSLTIPLSLVGELVVQGRSESVVYWIGAVIVVCSFVLVEREDIKEGHDGDDNDENDRLPGAPQMDDATAYTRLEQNERSSVDLPR